MNGSVTAFTRPVDSTKIVQQQQQQKAHSHVAHISIIYKYSTEIVTNFATVEKFSRRENGEWRMSATENVKLYFHTKLSHSERFLSMGLNIFRM